MVPEFVKPAPGKVKTKYFTEIQVIVQINDPFLFVLIARLDNLFRLTRVRFSPIVSPEIISGRGECQSSQHPGMMLFYGKSLVFAPNPHHTPLFRT